MDTLEGMPAAAGVVDWHRRAFELGSQLGQLGPLADRGDYAGALRLVNELRGQLPGVLAGLVDEGRAAGVLTWPTIGAALDRDPEVARRVYGPRNRHRLGTPAGRRRKQPAPSPNSTPGDGNDVQRDVA